MCIMVCTQHTHKEQWMSHSQSDFVRLEQIIHAMRVELIHQRVNQPLWPGVRLVSNIPPDEISSRISPKFDIGIAQGSRADFTA